LFGGIGTRSPSWVVAGATLVVAALFQPARRRIQQVVDTLYERLVSCCRLCSQMVRHYLGIPGRS
jgi:hypothetical protein